ncbi:MAG TPA: hypothetical protein VHE30_19765 [Polyangiaceae bacterium]|nr:hypothetical protein [Polyangiaceae bacterium]
MRPGRARLIVALGLLPATAAASPEFGSGIALGVAGTGDAVRWSRTKFYGALRGEALFGPAEPSALRLGPAFELGTTGFSDLRTGAGATLLVPLDDVLALGVTPGAYVRTGDGPLAGLSGRLFFGVHPYNRVGAYGLSAGLLAGIDRDLGSSPRSSIVVAAQVDGLALALPFVLLAEWIRGPRD